MFGNFSQRAQIDTTLITVTNTDGVDKCVRLLCAFDRLLHLHLTDCVLTVFFFQAEAGLRVPLVTGVQTCALPIWGRGGGWGCGGWFWRGRRWMRGGSVI